MIELADKVQIADFWVGSGDLVMIAGPCVIESADLTLSIARTLGGDYALRIRRGAPPVVNDGEVAGLVEEVALALLGPGTVRHGERGMGAEDFAVLAAQAPGAFFRLGCRIDGDERSIHNPNFDLNEACLPLGAALLAETALRLLGQEKRS